MRSFSALSLPAYRRYWIGHVVSLMGTAIQHTALFWLVYRLSGSPLALAITAACTQIPSLLFGILGGIVADRGNRRGLLISCYVFLIVQSLILAWWTLHGVIDLPRIYLMAVLHGIVRAFEVPTRQTFVKDLTSDEHLASGLALNSMAFNAGRLIGPPIAGGVIAVFGEGPCFAANALSYVAVIVGLLMLPRRRADLELENTAPVPLRRVFQYLRDDAPSRFVLAAVSVVSFFGIPVYNMLAVYAKEIYGRGPEALGILTGAGGLGAILGAWSVARKQSHEIHPGGVVVGMVGFTFSLAGLAAGVPYGFAIGCMVLQGASLLYMLVQCNHLLQTRAPDPFRGRVISIYTSLLIGLNPVGSLLLGQIAEVVGVQFGVGLGVVVLGAFLVMVKDPAPLSPVEC